MKFVHWLIVSLLFSVAISHANGQQRGKQGPPLTDLQLRERVLRSMKNGLIYLRNQQGAEGQWSADGVFEKYTAGLTGLSVLAMINCDVPVKSPEVQAGLRYLRSLPSSEPKGVYGTSVTVMALCAADQPNIDKRRIGHLAKQLELTQCRKGPKSGLWGYDRTDNGGVPGGNGEDLSNTQFAILALRDAAYAGVKVERETWLRTHEAFLRAQGGDGGWIYRIEDIESRASMTAAGLSTLAITTRMLQNDDDVDAEGQPDCCAPHPPEEAFERGRQWMADGFTVTANRGHNIHQYYYLYGLERASRLGNVRFYGDRDWYREGARYLVRAQNADGSWREGGPSTPPLTTAYALLFLSKGLSRVVINKLDYTSTASNNDAAGEWNRHPLDASNLIENVDGLKDWPPRLITQVLKLNKLNDQNAVQQMNQAPILYISGSEAIQLNDAHVKWLRKYVDEGGFIMAIANCRGEGFDKSFRQLIRRMFPGGEAELKKLRPDHPIFRSEYPMNADTIELHGVDFGCRTAIVYSPEDHACLWQKWMRHDPPDRHVGLIQRIIRSNRVGTNIIAYATGREPPVKLNANNDRKAKNRQRIQRGMMEVAQLKHAGGWETAPKALPNLLKGLNEEIGLAMSPQRHPIPVTFNELKRFPLAYMHGRYRFQLSQQEVEALRTYFDRGGMLFADSCCGAKDFDKSFRAIMKQVYPKLELSRIPQDHEIFTQKVGHDIPKVRLRKMVTTKNAAMETRVGEVPPILEGIEVEGRYTVIYSRYDLSCALENQASLACDGYEEADAMKLAMNIVLYNILSEVGGPAAAE